MYICKVIKKDVDNGTERTVFEKISTSGVLLQQRAKRYVRHHWNKKTKKNKEEKGYESKLSPFVELDGFKTDCEAFHPGHMFYHGSAVVFNCYGKPIWIMTMQIHDIDEVKDV